MKTCYTPALLICLTTGLFAADALPRYNLPAGRQMSYTFESATTGPAAYNSHDTWTLTVLAENKDGSRSILADGAMVRENTGELYGSRKGKSENHITFMFDINTRGQLLTPDATGDYARALFFPLLPVGAPESAAGWADGEDKNSTKEQGPAKFVFELKHADPVNSGSSVKTVEFDAPKGLVVKAQREILQEKSKGTESLTLTKDGKLEGSALEASRQFLIFGQAQRQYKETLEKIYEDPEHAQELLAKAAAIMNDGAKKATSPDVQKAFEQAIRSLPAEANAYAGQAQKLLNVVNKPAADFSVSDFDGVTWSKEKLKGSVVILDFWFRNCGWCIKAMPQIKEVAAQYKDKPVHIFGVNVDEKEEDGKFVIKALELNYPQLKGRPLVELFGVSGYPTLMILDQEGVVRGVHFGYSVNLKEKLAKKIDLLLSFPAGK